MIGTDPTLTVERILHRTPAIVSSSSIPVPPFPLDAFPQHLRDLVRGGAAAIGCPEDFIAVPLLPALGAALGNRAVLEIKAGLRTRAILWTAVVGLPGTGKTPGEELATSGLRAIQNDHAAEFEQARTAWEQEPPKGRGAPPRMQRALMGDATIESLAVALTASHGILVTRDELSSWLSGFARYRNEGSDRSSWLSIWSGSALDQERLSRSTVYVPFPHVCVSGGIQPERIGLLAGDVNDGFTDRVLGSWPDADPVPLSDEAVPLNAVAELRSLTQQLRHVPPPPMQYADPGQSNVWRAAPSRDAFERYREFFDGNLYAIKHGYGLGRGWAAKAPLHLQRLALLLHAIWNPASPGGVIDEETMERAVSVVEYFRAHHHRIIAAAGTGTIASPRQQPLIERVVGLLKRKGGWVSTSDLVAGIRTAGMDQLGPILTDLEAAGTVSTRTTPTATKPRQEWKYGLDDGRAFSDSAFPQNGHLDAVFRSSDDSAPRESLNSANPSGLNGHDPEKMAIPRAKRGNAESLNDHLGHWETGTI